MHTHKPPHTKASRTSNQGPLTIPATLCLLMTLLPTVAPTLAQTPSPDSSWHFSSSLGSSYNDNRDGASSNRQDNLDVTAGSRGTYQLRDGDRTELNLSLAPFASPTDEQDTLQGTKLFGSAAIDLKHQLTPALAATAGDALRYSDDADVPEQDTIQRTRTSTYLVHTAYVGTDAQIAPDVGVALNASTIGVRYDDETAAKQRNSDTYAGSATCTYHLAPDLSLFGQGGVSEYESPANSGSQGALIVSYVAGFTHMFSPDMIAKISGSYQTTQYKSEQPPSGMLGGQADLTFQATTPTRYHLTANYGYTDPNVADTDVQKKLNLIGSVDHDLIAEKLTIGTQLHYTDSQNASESNSRGNNSTQMIRMRGYGTYRLTHHWSSTLGYTCEDWRSVAQNSFQRNTLDASLLYTW